MPLRIPNMCIETHARIDRFRPGCSVPHAFTVQSFVGDLAAAAGHDPEDDLLEPTGPRGAPIRTAYATAGAAASRRSAIRSTPAACAT